MSLTFKVMSSEQEASSIPDGSHLMALTSFCKTQHSLGWPSVESKMRWDEVKSEKSIYSVSLEGLEGSVAAEATYVDAHVCTAGGEGGVVLPVDIQCWGCGIIECISPRSLKFGRFMRAQYNRVFISCNDVLL